MPRFGIGPIGIGHRGPKGPTSTLDKEVVINGPSNTEGEGLGGAPQPEARRKTPDPFDIRRRVEGQAAADKAEEAAGPDKPETPENEHHEEIIENIAHDDSKGGADRWAKEPEADEDFLDAPTPPIGDFREKAIQEWTDRIAVDPRAAAEAQNHLPAEDFAVVMSRANDILHPNDTTPPGQTLNDAADAESELQQLKRDEDYREPEISRIYRRKPKPVWDRARYPDETIVAPAAPAVEPAVPSADSGTPQWRRVGPGESLIEEPAVAAESEWAPLPYDEPVRPALYQPPEPVAAAPAAEAVSEAATPASDIPEEPPTPAPSTEDLARTVPPVVEDVGGGAPPPPRPPSALAEEPSPDDELRREVPPVPAVPVISEGLKSAAANAGITIESGMTSRQVMDAIKTKAKEPASLPTEPLSPAAPTLPPDSFARTAPEPSAGAGPGGAEGPPKEPLLTKDDLDLFDAISERMGKNENISPEDAARFIRTYQRMQRSSADHLRSLGVPDNQIRQMGVAIPETRGPGGPRAEGVMEQPIDDPQLRAFRDQYINAPVDFLTTEIGEIDRQMGTIRASIRPERGVTLDPAFVTSENNRLLILDQQRGILSSLRRQKIAAQNQTGNQVEALQAKQEARGEFETLRGFASKNAEELASEIGSIKTGIKGLESSLEAAYARGDMTRARALESELDRARAGLTSAESIKVAKDAEASKAERKADKKKGEQKHKERKAKDKTEAGQIEAIKLESMSATAIGAELKAMAGEFDDQGNMVHEGQLQKLQRELNALTDEKQRRAKTKEIIELNEKIGKYKEAQKNAKAKDAAKSGLTTEKNFDNLKDVSNEAFDEMSQDLKSGRISNIIDVLPHGMDSRITVGGKDLGSVKDVFDAAKKKLESGVRLNQLEQAVYIRQYADRIDKGGKDARQAIKEMGKTMVLKEYKWLNKTMMDRLDSSNALKALKEKHPGLWDRLKKTGADRPGLLMIILAILAGLVIGPGALLSGAAAAAKR